MRELFETSLGTAPNYSTYYVLGHFHAWGTSFRLSFVDEDGSERVIVDNANVAGDPLGITIDPPMHSEGAAALGMTCGYNNDTENTLRWGNNALSEMCQFLAYTEVPIKMAAFSREPLVDMGMSEDDEFLWDTPCGDSLFGIKVSE